MDYPVEKDVVGLLLEEAFRLEKAAKLAQYQGQNYAYRSQYYAGKDGA